MRDTKEKTLLTQYQEIKDSYKDAVVLFQIGGFYQAYYHDAKLLSEVLHLELVGKKVGGGNIIPMCGIPRKSVNKHITTLTELGYRVVLCEQKEDCLAEGGLRRREITEIFDPEEILKIDLTEQWENYLAWLNNSDIEKALPKKKTTKENAVTKDTGGLAILEELKALDLCRMTPFAAMELLYEWRQKFITSESGSR